MVRAEGECGLGNHFAVKGFDGGLINGYGKNIVFVMQGNKMEERRMKGVFHYSETRGSVVYIHP